MNIKRFAKYFWLAVFAGSASLALAHQPVFIGEAEHRIVSEPEISRAYYGFLAGEPMKFVISSSSTIPLYANLLVPVAPDSPRGLSLWLIDQDGQVLERLSGGEYDWRQYYEEYAGDEYWKGPELRRELAPGTYTLLLFSAENWERYVLAIGEREKFSASGVPGLLRELYLVKTEFFRQSGWTIFQGKIGYGLFIFVVLIAVLVVAIPFIIKFAKARR